MMKKKITYQRSRVMSTGKKDYKTYWKAYWADRIMNTHAREEMAKDFLSEAVSTFESITNTQVVNFMPCERRLYSIKKFLRENKLSSKTGRNI